MKLKAQQTLERPGTCPVCFIASIQMSLKGTQAPLFFRDHHSSSLDLLKSVFLAHTVLKVSQEEVAFLRHNHTHK